MIGCSGYSCFWNRHHKSRHKDCEGYIISSVFSDPQGVGVVPTTHHTRMVVYQSSPLHLPSLCLSLYKGEYIRVGTTGRLTPTSSLWCRETTLVRTERSRWRSYVMEDSRELCVVKNGRKSPYFSNRNRD